MKSFLGLVSLATAFSVTLIASPEVRADDAQLKTLQAMFKFTSQPTALYEKRKAEYQEFVNKNYRIYEAEEHFEECAENSWSRPFIVSYSNNSKRSQLPNGYQPKCQPFFRDYYRSTPEIYNKMLERRNEFYDTDDDLGTGTPEIFMSHNHQIHLKRLASVAQEAKQALLPQLRQLSANKNLSPTVVCSAVAIGDVISDLNAANLEQYSTRLNFLALTVRDWMVKTGGNVALCPNFGLELKVRELSVKTEEALRNARAAIGAAAITDKRLTSEIKQMKQNDIIKSAMFWGIGAVGYRTLFMAR